MDFFNSFKEEFVLNFVKDNRWKYLTDGLATTLKITLFSLIFGVVIGAVVAIVRATHDKNIEGMPKGVKSTLLKAANGLCRLYLTVVRGTPVVVQLLLMYYVILVAVDSKMVVATLAFGINSGAYVAEIIRGGIMSVDNGQMEAGRSLGFGYVQTMWHIVIPQALKSVLPALANEFIVLLKETSVAGYIALQDLTKGGDIIRSRTYSAFMPLIAVALIYLVMVIVFTKLVGCLERRLKNSER